MKKIVDSLEVETPVTEEIKNEPPKMDVSKGGGMPAKKSDFFTIALVVLGICVVIGVLMYLNNKKKNGSKANA